MKPLNLDNSPCSPISSNCVIWQGPNIPCIKLCTGDTVTDVVYALATKLCTLVDQVNISTLDLSCLKITTGTPTSITDLLQILINKICALNNIPASSGSVKRGPTDTIVPVAPCLQTGGQTTMKLTDYVQLIANTICGIVDDITTINNSILNLTTRVTALESIPPTPPYVLPSVTPQCTLDEGNVVGGTAYKLDIVLNALINDNDHGYCSVLGTLGQPSAIHAAYNLGNATVSGTDGALSNCALTLDQLFSTTWISSPTSLSQSFIDLWLTVKDIRNAYKRYNVTAGNSNVTVTTTTTPGTCGPEISFAVKSKSSSVSAGTNIVSVVPTTTDLNTDYVVNAKGTSVVAGTNVTVDTNTLDPANTIYTVNAKGFTVEGGDNTTVDVNTTNPANTIYTVNAALDTFVATTIINSTLDPNDGVIPIQTPGVGVSIGSDMKILKKYNIVNINNVSTSSSGSGSYVQGPAPSYLITLPFGTFNNEQGYVTITKPGTYHISGALQLKGANSDIPIWQTSGIGSFHLGILSNDNNVFTGNSQHVQGPIPSLGILGQHTTISLTSSIQVPISGDTVVRLGIFNFTDREYNGNLYDSSDIIRFSITKLN